MKQYPTVEQIYAVLTAASNDDIPNLAGKTKKELWELAKRIKAEAVEERARRGETKEYRRNPMSENRSKKPQALKEFFSLQDEYDQKELTAEEEKEFEFHRCGGVLFGSLSDLRVDVSEEIDTFAEMEKIASAILELIQKSCVKGIKGITHFISTHIKVDKKESENVWVVDCGILRPAKWKCQEMCSRGIPKI